MPSKSHLSRNRSSIAINFNGWLVRLQTCHECRHCRRAVIGGGVGGSGCGLRARTGSSSRGKERTLLQCPASRETCDRFLRWFQVDRRAAALSTFHDHHNYSSLRYLFVRRRFNITAFATASNVGACTTRPRWSACARTASTNNSVDHSTTIGIAHSDLPCRSSKFLVRGQTEPSSS